MVRERKINALDIFSATLAAMISSGIFILPVFLYPAARSSMIISYALAGFFFLIAVLSHGEMISAFPDTGESRFLPYRSMGPFMGTVNGLAVLLSMILKASFALFGLAYTLSHYLGFPFYLSASAGAGILGILHCLPGRNYTLRNIAALTLLVLVGFFFLKGIPWVRAENLNLHEDFPGFFDFLSNTAFLFIAYGGFQGMVDPSRKIRNPGFNIPLGIFLASFFITLIYIAVGWLITGISGPDLLKGPILALSETAGLFLGSFGKLLFAAVGFVAFIITADTSLFSASRYLQSLSKDNLLPSFFKKSSALNTPPILTIALTAILAGGATWIEPVTLIRLGSSAVILASLFTCVSLIILRESHIQDHKPSFRAPFYPWLQILAGLVFFLMLFQIGEISLILTLSLMALSLLAYLFYGRKRNEKNYALIRLIERITHKEIAKRTEEKELEAIIQEKDPEKVADLSFYLRESLVLDIPKKSDLSNLFEIISEKISQVVSVNPHDFFELLLKRENQGSTAINSFAAIPHILVPGEKIFQILLLRCRPGIFFSKDAPSVQCVFVLTGTLDNRSLHLKAVSALAKILQKKEFEERWMRAKSLEELKSLLLPKTVKNPEE